MAQGSEDFGGFANQSFTHPNLPTGFSLLYSPDTGSTISERAGAIGGKVWTLANAGGGASAIVLDGAGTPAGDYDLIIAGWAGTLGAEGFLPVGQSGATSADRVYYSRATADTTQWLLRYVADAFTNLGSSSAGAALNTTDKFFRRVRRESGRVKAAIRLNAADLMGTPSGGWDLDVAESTAPAQQIGIVGTIRSDIIDWISWGTGADLATNLEAAAAAEKNSITFTGLA